MSYKNIDTTEEDRATADLNGINYNTLKSRLAAGWPKELAINKSPLHRYGNEEYALYKGEEFIEIGTLQELAELRGVQLKTIKFYLTPMYQKKIAERKNARDYITLSKMEDDEE